MTSSVSETARFFLSFLFVPSLSWQILVVVVMRKRRRSKPFLVSRFSFLVSRPHLRRQELGLIAGGDVARYLLENPQQALSESVRESVSERVRKTQNDTLSQRLCCVCCDGGHFHTSLMGLLGVKTLLSTTNHWLLYVPAVH